MWCIARVRSYLSDILVPHPADLLDVCGGLGDSLERVAEQNQLILLCLGDLDVDSGLHDDLANKLLADEVTVDPRISAFLFYVLKRPDERPQLFSPSHSLFFFLSLSSKTQTAPSNIPDLDLVDTVGVLVQVDVDGEMGVDVSHLVLEALGNTDDQVVDEGADGSESGNGLADAMVDVDGDDVLLWRGEGDGDVREVLDQLAPRALNSDLSCLDLDLDCWWRQDLVSIWCNPCVGLYVCSRCLSNQCQSSSQSSLPQDSQSQSSNSSVIQCSAVQCSVAVVVSVCMA